MKNLYSKSLFLAIETPQRARYDQKVTHARATLTKEGRSFFGVDIASVELPIDTYELF